MRTTRSHYEVLGLPRNVNPAQIKRRYRELVRKFHPDVSKDKTTSHRLFLQINEAYEVLSDSDRRKAYDETLDLDAMIRAKRAAGATTTPSGQPSQPPGTSTPRRNNGQLLKDAQFAFIQKRLSTAADLCKEALQADPRNARACAMLGDIYRAQGKSTSAIKYYNFAIQFDPKDNESQKKLLNLIGKQVEAQRAHGTAQDPAKLRVLNAIWWSIVFLLIMLIKIYPGTPIPWLKGYIPQVSMWSWNLVGFIAAASALAGALLSLNGLLRHPDDELVFDRGGTWVVVPLGLVFFPGAAGFYILLGLLQGSLSRSVLTVFGLVVGIVLFASLLYEPHAGKQVLLFGGNVAFLSSLFGWYTGAALKPLSAE